VSEVELKDSEGFRGRVLVLGGRGMLGRAVATAARAAKYQTWVSGSEHDISDWETMHRLDGAIHPHVVVNCAGLIPQRMTGLHSPSDMVRVNALGPWVVRDAFPNCKVILVSSDCVFGGYAPGVRSILDRTDPIDLYGRTKVMGEVSDTVIVRTSFIGLQHGLLNWFLSQPDGATIEGYTQAYWSGSTVYDVADMIIKMFHMSPSLYHMAAPVTTKYQLLVDLKDAFAKDVNIVPVDAPVVYRGLKPTVGLLRDLTRLVEAYDREPATV